MPTFLLNGAIVITTLYIIIVLIRSIEEFIISVKLFKIIKTMQLKKRGPFYGRTTTTNRNKRNSK